MACPKFTHMSNLGSFLSSQVFYWHFTYVNSSLKMSLRFLLRFLSSVDDTLSAKIIVCIQSFSLFRYCVDVKIMITAAPKKISAIYFIDIVRRVVREAIDNGVFSRRHNK